MGGCEVRTAPFTRTASYSPVSSAVKLGYRGFGLLGAVKRGVRRYVISQNQLNFLVPTLVKKSVQKKEKLGSEGMWRVGSDERGF